MSDKKKKTDNNPDSTLFRDAVGDVKPVHHDRVTPESKKPAPRRIKQRHGNPGIAADDLTAGLSDEYLPVKSGDSHEFMRPGVQHRLFKRLRQGTMRIDADLDLHGLTIPEARSAVAEFIHECTLRRIRVALIIHGKGFSSAAGKPVLKNRVDSWLRQHPAVLAFCSAQPRHGGSGAVYVLLRQK